MGRSAMPLLMLVLLLLASACAPADEADEGPPSLSTLLSREVVVQRIVDAGAIASLGSVTFEIVRSDERPLVVNLLVDLDGNGVWAEHAVGAQTQSEWLVQNLSLPALPGSYSGWTTLLESPSGAKARVVLSGDALAEGAVTSDASPDGAESFELSVSVAELATTSKANPADGFVGGGGSEVDWEDVPLLSPAAPGSPAEPQDDTTATGLVRRGLTVTPQGPNTCVLHALATSMAWMARKHGFADRFPDYDVSVDEGVNDMAYDLDDVGAMGWDPEKGVAPAKIVPGKQAFVAQKQLPLETQVKDIGAGADLFAELQKAMRDGCDVEIVLAFPDVQFSHMVVAAGFSESGGARSLLVRNPDSPNATDAYGLGADGRVQRFPFKGALRDALLGRLVIECYKAPSQTSFIDVSPTELEFAHVPSDDSCPQEAGVLALTNTSTEAVSWTASTGGRTEVKLAPSSGLLEPAATSEVAVLFNCGGGGDVSFSLPVLLLAGTGSGSTSSVQVPIAGTVTDGVVLTKTAEVTPLVGGTVARNVTISHPFPREARVLRHELVDDATGLPPATGLDQPFADHKWSIVSEKREQATATQDAWTIEFRYELVNYVDHVAPAKSWSYIVKYAVP